MAYPVPRNLTCTAEVLYPQDYPGAMQSGGHGGPQLEKHQGGRAWKPPSNTPVRARELRRIQQKREGHAQRGNPLASAPRLSALERENIARQQARRAHRNAQEANFPPSPLLRKTRHDTPAPPPRSQHLPVETRPTPDALDAAAPFQSNRLAQRMWETGMELGGQLLDGLLPRFPGAGAMPAPMPAQTCAGPECGGEKRSRLHDAPETLDSLRARGSEHFHFHLGDSLTGQTSLAGKLVIFVFDPDLHASGEQPWRALFEGALRKGDVLLKERQHGWQTPSHSLKPLDGMPWQLFGQQIDGAELNLLRKQARRAMRPLIDAMKTALTTEVTVDASFWTRSFHEQTKLLDRLVARIEFAPPESHAPGNGYQRVGECLPALDDALKAVQLESGRLSELRARQFLSDRNYVAAPQASNRFVVMDIELFRRLEFTLLQGADHVVVTDKRVPLNLGRKPSYRHRTTIRYVQELVAAQNGRVLISPTLRNRPDQSLAGTVIVFADEQHERFEGRWQQLQWSIEMLTETDTRLVEIPSDKKPTFLNCLGLNLQCIAIDDAASRKKIDAVIDAFVNSFVTFGTVLEADGVTAMPSREVLLGMSVYDLMPMFRQVMALYIRDSNDLLRSPSACEHFDQLLQAQANFSNVIIELDPIRNRAIFGAMKSHLSADHACSASLGAQHVFTMQAQLLEELPAIIIWPDDPDTTWSRDQRSNRGTE